jgi:hypothetical protein
MRQLPLQLKEYMKSTNLIAIAALIVSAITLPASAHSETEFSTRSPKAQSFRDEYKKVSSGSVNDPNLLANRPVGNAKAWELMKSLRSVTTTPGDLDLAHASRPNVPAKSSRYDTVLMENAQRTFQVAPLK